MCILPFIRTITELITEGEGRVWAFVCADCRATDLRILIEGGPDKKFTCLEQLMAIFHETKAFVEGVMKIIWRQGFKACANILGFESPKALLLVSDVHDLHKVNQILRDMFKVAILETIIMEFFEYKNTTSTITATYALSVEFLADLSKWIDDNCKHDVTFANHIAILTELLIPYELIVAGVRNEIPDCYSAGRRHLFWVAFVCNNTTFCYNIAHDILRFDFQAPPEVRELRNTMMILDGQGADAKKEEGIKEGRRFTPTSTKIGIEWGAYFRNSSSLVRAKAFQICGLQDRDVRERTSVDHSVGIRKLRDFLLRVGAFRPIKDRNHCLDLTMRKIVRKEHTVLGLKESGTQGKNEFLPRFLANYKAKAKKAPSFDVNDEKTDMIGSEDNTKDSSDESDDD